MLGLYEVGYDYDDLGRLDEAILSPLEQTAQAFAYTCDTTKQPLTWETESVTLYVYDGWRMILELDALDDDAPLRSHYWGLDLSGTLDGAAGIGGLLATVDHDTPTTYFVLFDGHGNVTQLVDADDGSEAAEFEYDPYGHRIDTRPDQPLPFGFSTKFLEPETGLYYYGFRWYQPAWGRWLSRDPIAEQGGLSLYLFLRNNPVGMLDKDGRIAVAVLAAPGAALGPLGGLVIVGTLTVWLSYNIDWERAWSDLIESVRSLDPRKWRCFCRVRNPVFKTCPRPLFTTAEQAADDYVPKYTQYMGPFVQLPFLQVSVYDCAPYSASPTRYPGVYIRLNVVYVKSGMEVSKPISYSIRCCACCKLFRASVCCEALHQSGEDKDRRPEFPERDSPFPVLPPRP